MIFIKIIFTNFCYVIALSHYKGKNELKIQIQNVQTKELILFNKPKALHFRLYTTILNIIIQFTIPTHKNNIYSWLSEHGLST